MPRKQGKTFRLKIIRFKDRLTGREVEKLSHGKADTVLSYFTREIITPDNRGVLLASNRSGKWLPYLIFPDERTMRCLCTTPMCSWASPAVGGERVVFVSEDGRLGYVPLEGGAFRAIVELPREREYSHVAASSCGRYAFLLYSEQAPRTTKTIADGRSHSSGSERTAFGLRTVMLRVNLDTSITKALTGGLGSFFHPMISPADPTVMEYCADTMFWRQGQRMWTIRYHERAALVEVRPLFRQRFGIDSVGHEFFLQDGRVAAVYMRYAKITDPIDQPKDSFILIADPISGRHRAYKTTTMLHNHLHGRDGRLFVSEGISGKAGPKTMDLLCRYDVRGQRAVSTPLCQSGCSWKGQLGHPHAVLDRTNRWCYFNSDRNGRCHVYRVRMD
jgi:hypothetical protein